MRNPFVHVDEESENAAADWERKENISRRIRIACFVYGKTPPELFASPDWIHTIYDTLMLAEQFWVYEYQPLFRGA